MFERYTEEARRALFYARFETSQRGGMSIESEHLLVGLIRETRGPVNAILAHFQVLPLTVFREIDARAPLKEGVPTSVEIPFSPEVQPMAASPPGATTRVDGILETIKDLVEQLGHAERNGSEAMELIAQIHRRLDALKPHLH
jgi:ATP-dependent Clp protease ATP-binding subunit ClpA